MGRVIYLYILSFFLTACLFYFCYYKLCKSNNVAIEIEKYTISNMEFDLKFSKFYLEYTELHKKNPNLKECKAWFDNLLDESFFLADAYDQKLENSILLLNKIRESERIIVTQEHGLLFDKVIVPSLNISNEEIFNVYIKTKYNYILSYAYFPDTCFKMFNKKIVVADSNRILINDGNIKGAVTANNVTIGLPNVFLSSVQDTIIKLLPRKLTNPICTDKGTFIFLLHKKINNPKHKSSFLQSKRQFKKYLANIKAKSVLENLNKKFLDSSNLNINYFNFNLLLKTGYKKQLSNNNILYEYSVGNLQRIVDFKSFIPYLASNMKDNTILTKELLINTIRSSIIEDYRLVTAQKLGLLDDPEYIAKKKNFFHTLLLNQYKSLIIRQFTKSKNLNNSSIMYEKFLLQDKLKELKMKYTNNTNFNFDEYFYSKTKDSVSISRLLDY